MRRRAKYALAPASAALCLFSLLSAADAARAADPQDGYRLAKRWCTTCHIIGPGESGSDAARPFASIANDPAFTEDGIRAWLADPHPPMPNLGLSRSEIDQVLAYLRSLRRE